MNENYEQKRERNSAYKTLTRHDVRTYVRITCTYGIYEYCCMFVVSLGIIYVRRTRTSKRFGLVYSFWSCFVLFVSSVINIFFYFDDLII